MKTILIRHGKTSGNILHRYIGTTDEALCEEGIQELEVRKDSYHFSPDFLFVSPLLRCRQTASILFPDIHQNIIEDLRECDFGEFENKNYLELSGNKNYQRWIDSNGTLPFPGGEDVAAFKLRCVNAFHQVYRDYAIKEGHTVAFVIHGGTIMSIMESLNTDPGKTYYDFHVKNGECCTIEHMVAFS